MKPILPFLVALPLILGGQAVRADEAPEPAADKEAAAARLPQVELSPSLLYRFLLAEIAGQRGQVAQSALLYRDLAKETRDPRVARRATEIALHGRQLELAHEAAQIWQGIEPDSPQARQTLIRLLAALNRPADLAREVATLLAAEPQHIAQNLLHLNRLFARSGDRQTARAVIDTVTAPYLERPEAHYARAVAAFEAQDLPAARAAIERAAAMKPDWDAAALLRFQLTEDRAAALAQLADFLARQPQARDVRLTYARALVGDKRYAEARKEFDRLLEQEGGTPNGDTIFAVAVLSLQLNDTAAAEKQLRRLIEIGHAEADKARFYLGQIAEETKRWDEALQWFGAVGRGEHYLSARLHGANLLAKQGKTDAAREHLAASEAATPRERVQLLIGEAQLLRDAGRTADALATLTGGLVQQPDQPELMYEAALLEEKLGRLDDMEKRLRRLIELQPNHAHALNALGYSLADRNLRLAEARQLIERALALAPDDPFILDSQGWVQFRLGDAATALDTLQRAFGIRPDPEIAAHLGEVLWSLGRQAEARATWDKAHREHPGNEALAATIKRLSSSSP